MYRFREKGTGSVFLDWCLLAGASGWLFYTIGMVLMPNPYDVMHGPINPDTAYNFGTLLYVAQDQETFDRFRALGNLRTEEWVIAALKSMGGPAGSAFEQQAAPEQRDAYAGLHMALDDKGGLLPDGWADTANF